MNIMKKFYENNVRSLMISKHNFTNTNFIPKIKYINLKLKTSLKTDKKIWVILFWSIFLLTGQKPQALKKKEVASYTDTRYTCVFNVNLTKKKMFFFLTKYIYFIIPKIEDIDTFIFKTNKKDYVFSVQGYMNYFETINIYNFLGDSELFLINHLKFELSITMYNDNKLHNINLLRFLQIPLLF